MKKNQWLLLLLVFCSCQTSSKDDKKLPDKPSSENKPEAVADIPPDSVVNKSYASRNGERFLRLEVIVPASIDSVWESFSTEEGVKTWMAPVSQLDFRIGGIMRNHMDYRKKIGDPGTLTLRIINYIPKELLVYKVELGKYFAPRLQEEDQYLQEIIQLKPVDKNHTKLTSSMIGWGKGAEWDKTYDFFVMGNKWCYDVMIKRFKNGPIYWPNDP